MDRQKEEQKDRRMSKKRDKSKNMWQKEELRPLIDWSAWEEEEEGEGRGRRERERERETEKAKAKDKKEKQKEKIQEEREESNKKRKSLPTVSLVKVASTRASE